MKSRKFYPVIISKEPDGYFVTIPDFNVNTQGENVSDATYMSKDAIELVGVNLLEDGKELPNPFSVSFEKTENDIVILIDVDFEGKNEKTSNSGYLFAKELGVLQELAYGILNRYKNYILNHKLELDKQGSVAMLRTNLSKLEKTIICIDNDNEKALISIMSKLDLFREHIEELEDSSEAK